MKTIFYYTKFSDNIKNEAKEKRMSVSAVSATKLLNNLYTFNDVEIRNGRKPKRQHGVKRALLSLTDKEYEEVKKLAKHYNMDIPKFVAFIINQHFEGATK